MTSRFEDGKLRKKRSTGVGASLPSKREKEESFDPFPFQEKMFSETAEE